MQPARINMSVAARGTRGFTLLEMVVSLLVLAVLAGLIVVGAVHVNRLAKDTIIAQQTRTIGQAIEHFKNQTGILPPLVRDQQTSNSMVVTQPGTQNARVNVIRADGRPTDADFKYLHGENEPTPAAGAPFGATKDARYSERTLAIYLMGALNSKDLVVGTSGGTLPLDGVSGLGLYKPFANGTFDIPVSVKKRASDPAQYEAVREGTILGPYVEPTSGKVTYADSTETSVQLVDQNNIAYRFYRWLPGTLNATTNTYEVKTNADLHIPLLVGRDATLPVYNGVVVPADRDINKNPALKTATWAVVAAGRNRAFGDEPLAELGRLLGRTIAPGDDEAKARLQAEADNVVEVGQ